MYSVFRSACPLHMICEYLYSQCSYLFRIQQQNVRFCGEYSSSRRPVSIINMVVMVTNIMEPVVSIITSYHGYSGSCISLPAVVSQLSRKLAQKKSTLLLRSLREVQCKFLVAQSGVSNLIKIFP
jgi:hypothetical protein